MNKFSVLSILIERKHKGELQGIKGEMLSIEAFCAMGASMDTMANKLADCACGLA